MPRMRPAPGVRPAFPEFEKPQDSLVPIGNSPFYITPGDPADPQDCDRWPDSPWCGGTPFSKKPVSLDIAPVVDECTVGIEFQPVLGFVKGPRLQIAYRAPGCRKPKEPKPSNEPGGKNPLKIPGNYGDQDTVIAVIKTEQSALYIANGRRDTRKTTYSLLEVVYPGEAGLTEGEKSLIEASTQGRYEAVNQTYGLNVDLPTSEAPAALFPSDEAGDFRRSFGITLVKGFGSVLGDQIGQLLAGACFIVKGRVEGLKRFYEGSTYISDVGTYTKVVTQSTVLWIKKLDSDQPPDEENKEKPPPPPKPCKPCMNCCCKNSNDDELKRLLKLILQRIGPPKKPAENILDAEREIIKFLGIERMPAKMPKRLTYPNGKGQEELKDLLDLLGYQVRQVDRAVGYFPQKIKIADTNPVQKGNQSVEVEIQSLADLGRELLTYLIDTEGDVDATNNMLVRLLYEAGFIHQGSVQANAMLDAICEHLDFKQRWGKVRVPFAFDPYAGQKGKVGEGFAKQKNAKVDAKTEEQVESLLPQLLQNTEVEIRILLNEEKKSLNDMLQDIKRDTASAAAGVTEKGTPERLEQLVTAAQAIIQLQGALDRKNTRQALTSGNLRTRKKSK